MDVLQKSGKAAQDQKSGGTEKPVPQRDKRDIDVRERLC